MGLQPHGHLGAIETIPKGLGSRSGVFPGYLIANMDKIGGTLDIYIYLSLYIIYINIQTSVASRVSIFGFLLAKKWQAKAVEAEGK